MTKSGARSATKGRGGEGGVPDLLRLGAKQSMRWLGQDALMIKLAISPASEPAEKPGEFADCGGLDRGEHWLVNINWNDGATHDAQS